MLLFAHTGITVGIVRACSFLVSKSGPNNCSELDCSSGFSIVIRNKQLYLNYLLNRVKSQIGSIDYRIILLGSLLPDIIDKPVWLFTGGRIFPSGMDYGHTLLFSLTLFICGLILAGYRKSWLLVISLCSFMHLIFDQIWNNPVTLFWPLLGPLSGGDAAGWMPGIAYGLFNSPETYIPEILGMVIVLLFAYRLVKRKGITSFIREGVIA